MKKKIEQEVVVCDGCGIQIGDSFRLLEPCNICGGDVCSGCGATVYFNNCIERGVFVCRTHLPAKIFSEENHE